MYLLLPATGLMLFLSHPKKHMGLVAKVNIDNGLVKETWILDVNGLNILGLRGVKWFLD